MMEENKEWRTIIRKGRLTAVTVAAYAFGCGAVPIRSDSISVNELAFVTAIVLVVIASYLDVASFGVTTRAVCV
jgi:hypothetical protein